MCAPPKRWLTVRINEWIFAMLSGPLAATDHVSTIRVITEIRKTWLCGSSNGTQHFWMVSLRRPGAWEILQNAQAFLGQKRSMRMTSSQLRVEHESVFARNCVQVEPLCHLSPALARQRENISYKVTLNECAWERPRFKPATLQSRVLKITLYDLLTIRVLALKMPCIYFVCSAKDQVLEPSKFGWNRYAKWTEKGFLHLVLPQGTIYNVSMESS